MKYIQKITLDLYELNTYKYVRAKQGDERSRFLQVTITSCGDKITPDDGSEIIFRALKPDGTSIYNPATKNEDGTVTVELTDQTLAVDGKVVADLSIVSDGIASTLSFFIQVDRAPLGKNIPSDNEFLVLVEATKKANEATAGANEAAKKATDAATAADTARQAADEAEKKRAAAETQREKDEKARADAEANRKTEEDARNTAEAARASAEEQREQDFNAAIEASQKATGAANDAATAAGTAADAASKAAGDANSAAGAANTAADAANTAAQRVEDAVTAAGDAAEAAGTAAGAADAAAKAADDAAQKADTAATDANTAAGQATDAATKATEAAEAAQKAADEYADLDVKVQDADLAIALLADAIRQQSWEKESGQLTLTNTTGYPFNSSAKSVALKIPREGSDYVVLGEVVSAVGNVGEIVVTDKLTNGFKIGYTGSATSAVIKFVVIGGYLK